MISAPIQRLLNLADESRQAAKVMIGCGKVSQRNPNRNRANPLANKMMHYHLQQNHLKNLLTKNNARLNLKSVNSLNYHNASKNSKPMSMR